MDSRTTLSPKKHQRFIFTPRMLLLTTAHRCRRVTGHRHPIPTDNHFEWNSASTSGERVEVALAQNTFVTTKTLAGIEPPNGVDCLRTHLLLDLAKVYARNERDCGGRS